MPDGREGIPATGQDQVREKDWVCLSPGSSVRAS